MWVSRELTSKGIPYGIITARADGSVDTSAVDGVDHGSARRPFFAHGGTISIASSSSARCRTRWACRRSIPISPRRAAGGHVVTPSGMVLDGTLDGIEAPPTTDPAADADGDGMTNEIPESLVDYLEFYLLNYFKAGHTVEDPAAARSNMHGGLRRGD